MVFYRFTNIRTNIGVKIEEGVYELVKETPRGYWIVFEGCHGLAWDKNGKINYKYCHWTSKYGKKRFAYPDRNQAFESFLARKKRQIQILQSQLEFTELALQKAENLKNKEQETTD